MLILGLETSCDETAAAVVRDGREILSNIVASQQAIHAKFGGVVPEVACRAHIELITQVIGRALADAAVGAAGLDAVAVVNGPGLVGALLVGAARFVAERIADRAAFAPRTAVAALSAAAGIAVGAGRSAAAARIARRVESRCAASPGRPIARRSASACSACRSSAPRSA